MSTYTRHEIAPRITFVDEYILNIYELNDFHLSKTDGGSHWFRETKTDSRWPLEELRHVTCHVGSPEVKRSSLVGAGIVIRVAIEYNLAEVCGEYRKRQTAIEPQLLGKS